jgi:hypothetical protein
MFQGISQGATLYILYKNEPRIEMGRVLSVNTHLPQFNPNQPQAMLGGMVTDLTVAVGSETIPFAGLPASASVANFPDRGMFISENQALVVNELTAMRDNSQRIVDSYDAHKALLEKYEALLLSLNPERQKEVQSAKEMADLKGELAEMKKMLSAVLGTKNKEEK